MCLIWKNFWLQRVWTLPHSFVNMRDLISGEMSHESSIYKLLLSVLFSTYLWACQSFFFSVNHQKYKQIRKLLKFSDRETLVEVLAIIFHFSNIKVSQIRSSFCSLIEVKNYSFSYIYSWLIDVDFQTQYPEGEMPLSSLPAPWPQCPRQLDAVSGALWQGRPPGLRRIRSSACPCWFLWWGTGLVPHQLRVADANVSSKWGARLLFLFS